MAHFAEIDDNNIVKRIVVVNNDVIIENNEEKEEKGINFLKNLYNDNSKWIQTSYNKKFRKRYADIGDYYDPIKDAFMPQKPFESWVFNENIWNYEAPIKMPITYINFPKDRNGNPITNLVLNEDLTIKATLKYDPNIYDGYFWNENIKNWELTELFWNEEKQNKFLLVNNL